MHAQLYNLAAFEPTDEEICLATGQDADMDDGDDVDETLGGFIAPDGDVDADEDDDDFGKAVLKKKPKQPNRAIIQDSDDEDAQQSEAEEEYAPKAFKGKGKETDDKTEKKKKKKKGRTMQELQWMREQEPSTKMLWVMSELERMFKENPDGACPLSLLSLRPPRTRLTRTGLSHAYASQTRSSSSRRSSPPLTCSTTTSSTRECERCATRAT